MEQERKQEHKQKVDLNLDLRFSAAEVKVEDVLTDALVAAYRIAREKTARRCIEIVMESLTTVDGERYRDRAEVVHAISRECLEWGGI